MSMLPECIDQRLADFILNGKHDFPFNAISKEADGFRYVEGDSFVTLFLAYDSGHVYHFEIMYEGQEIIYQKAHLFSPQESLAFTELVRDLVNQ